MDDELLSLCRENIEKYHWTFLCPEDLATKVVKSAKNKSKWEYVKIHEYFSELLRLLMDKETTNETKEGVWQEIWAYVRGRSFRVGRERGMTRSEDLKELAQQAMFLVFQQFYTVRQSFIAFCNWKILQAWSEFIADQKQPTVPLSDVPEALDDDIESKPHESVASKILSEQVRAVFLHKMRNGPSHVRVKLQVIFWKDIEEKTYEEIASLIGVDKNYAYQLYGRGMKILSENSAMRKLL